MSGDYSRWGPRVFLGSTAIVVIVAWVLYATHPSRSSRPLAIYPTFFAIGNPHFSEFVTGEKRGVDLAPIYLQLPDNSVVFLPDCTESELAPFVESGNSGFEGVTVRRMGHSHFDFRDGKLIAAAIRGDLLGFRIGSQKTGPFYALPITREILLRLFGKPIKWQRASLPRVA